jgi:hypothetical protein
MTSEKVSTELFFDTNVVECTDTEKNQTEELQKLLSTTLINKSSIKITHFSDSIVLSIELKNDMNTMSLIEYIGRLVYSLWRDFKILIRGGVSVDKLIHTENGALFGPAMVNAYDIETNLANYPRIVFDETSFSIIQNSPSFKTMKNLFIPFSEEKTINNKTYKIKNGCEINLATSLNHLLNSHFSSHPTKRKEILNEVDTSVFELANLLKEAPNKVKEKYQYLIDQINKTEFPKH